jgi:hypothetical protein
MHSAGYPYPHDRLLEATYPWSTIGKFWVGTTTGGWQFRWNATGVLIGPNLVLTAGHALPWSLLPNWYMRFVPAYHNGEMPFGQSYVSEFRGFNPRGDVTGKDYGVCRLYTPLGASEPGRRGAGWMGTQSWGSDDRYYEGSWITAGYPGSFFNGEHPGVEYFLKVEDVDHDGSGRELETRQFANPGWSGGPLFGWVNGDPKVIGIESGEERDFLQPTWNVFAGGSPMVDLVKYGLANWPA